MGSLVESDGNVTRYGPLAQLVAHLHDTQGVVGSSPARPTLLTSDDNALRAEIVNGVWINDQPDDHVQDQGWAKPTSGKSLNKPLGCLWAVGVPPNGITGIVRRPKA